MNISASGEQHSNSGEASISTALDMRPSPLPRLVLAVLGAALCTLCLTVPFHYVLATLSDDAFYYFKIARNIALGGGCTFDGLVATNGYHPLWTLCLIPLFYFFGEDLETPIRIVLAGSCLLALVTLFLLYRVVNTYSAPKVAAVAVAACLLPNVLSAMLNGMETGITLFAVVLLVWACYRWPILERTHSVKYFFVLGLLLGLVTLCRLDMVFMMFATLCLMAVVFTAVQRELRACVWRLGASCLGFLTALGPYFLWNIVTFGHITPISGTVKSTFPAIRNTLSLRGDQVFGAYLLGALLALTILAVLIDLSRGRPLSSILGSPLTILALGCSFHFVHVLLFLDWGVYWWHFAVYGLALAIALAKLVHRLTASRPRLCRVISTLLVTVLVGAACIMKVREIGIRAQRHRAWLAAARWARGQTPQSAIFAIKDAGFFGYFSDRRVINLDGKANGYRYREHVIAGDVEGYLRRMKVDYVADIGAYYESRRFLIMIPRPNRTPVVLRMSEREEVYRSRAVPRSAARFGSAPMGHFVVWKYPGLSSTL